ncbi:LPXTG cell wall anchor domain-containing protein [Lacticaseibacillus nasuensis]|uniref:Gram-positive cocci surface proteins LPxTG domain-containing protein n=1 Tax=Lacticaseibacillus nasuensis JCM 17158 TaxID=1291734 RepID=A0A0R1JIC3_9LACO|nr:LPXTG cell wall anchor domain-containing protein [Lacticaseibacillus nasuensis]KRK71039.1 hypothetical protein FD02_GL000224 [Lacticaseibacillus nasuensis JCM 17158]
MKFSKVGIALAGVAVLLAVPVVPVAASESATGSTIAEFKVTGKRPKPEPTVLPPRRPAGDRLPGTQGVVPRHLPQTGDQGNAWWSLAGIAVMVGMSWVAWRRKEDSDEEASA